MLFNYKFKPVFMEKLYYVTHKGKKRDFHGHLHTHAVNAHEIIYVDYGEVNLLVGKKEIKVNPGECIFIRGGIRHSFIGESKGPFDFLNIAFHGKAPLSLFGKCLPVNRKCLELLNKLKEESVQDMPYCREIISSVLTELIVRFLRQVELSIPNKLPESFNPKSSKSDYVYRALAIITNKYSKALSLSSVSRAAGIGKSRLHKLLKIETGENFTAILHKQRITSAKHLLNDGTFSLESIANAVGYQSSSFFFKIFKRATGMTPKAYLLSLGEPTEFE